MLRPLYIPFLFIFFTITPYSAASQEALEVELFPLCIVEERCGYIDVNGNWKIDPIYQNTRPFKNGFAVVQIDRDWGMINTNGEWVIGPSLPFIYHQPFREFHILNTDSVDFVINAAGEMLFEFRRQYSDIVFAFPNEGLTVHRDQDSRELSLWQNDQPVYQNDEITSIATTPEGGMLMVVRGDDNASIVVSEKLENLDFPPVDFISGSGREGIYVTRLEGKTGYITSEGDWVIEPKFEGGTSPSEDRAFVLDDGNYYLIDMAGNIIRNVQYETFGHFVDGFAVVGDRNVDVTAGNTYVIDYDGVERLHATGRLSNHGNGLFSSIYSIWSAEKGWISQDEFSRISYMGDGYFKARNATEEDTYLFFDGTLISEIKAEVIATYDPLDVQRLKNTGICNNCNLRGADLSNLTLDFNGAHGSVMINNSDASGANFSSAIFESVIVTNSIFTDANFSGSTLKFTGDGNNFIGSNFFGSSLEITTKNSDFSFASFQDTTIDGYLSNNNFSNSDMSDALLLGRFRRSIFTGANFDGVRFLSADLNDAILREIDLRNASFEGMPGFRLNNVDISNSNIDNREFLDSIKSTEVVVCGVLVQGSTISSTSRCP